VAAGASFVVFLLYIACSQDKGRISHAMERHNASRALDMGAGSETRRDGGGPAATRAAQRRAAQRAGVSDGGGGCKLDCGDDGRALRKGLKTRSLPTASLHPGVLLSSPFRSSQKYGCPHLHMYKHIYICTHLYIYPYNHKYTLAYIHTCIHTYIHTYTHVYIHEYIHK